MLTSNYEIGFLTILISAFIQGITGFGFALIAVPILSCFILPKEVVPIIVVYGLITNIMMIMKRRESIRVKELSLLIIAGMIGVPFGVYLLKVLPTNSIKLIAGIIIVITAVAMVGGLRIKFKNEQIATGLAGFLSGVLNSSTSMSGPPIVLFYANKNVAKDVFRTSLPAFGIITNITTIALFMASAMINKGVIKYLVSFSPALILGALMGIWLAKLINEKMFRNISLILILTLGAYTILTSLRGV